MTWLNVQEVIWEEPLAFAKRFAGEDMSLLYSGMREQHTGGISYLAVEPVEVVSGAGWDALPELGDGSDGLPEWFGHLGYELHEQEKTSRSSLVALPPFRLMRYAHLFRFDHMLRVINHYSRDGNALEIPETKEPAGSILVDTIASNMTRAQYEQSVADTVECIHAGDFYQANITRKFHGAFSGETNSFALFVKLTEASPAPYSAYIRHGRSAILSASPECFLTARADGTLITRPIKGSARRGKSETEDTQIREALATSTKNHAENLMIVDLMRNDLSRVSAPESVAVTEQSGLYTYATIHHLISTVTAKKRADVSVKDVVRACFPPGSMTGAPKIAAINWCATQEKVQRGVYSGAIGWFGGNHTCDLSVVIRTLLIEGENFEFQVGGGIVADSTPAEEWQETLTKARGILAALGLDESAIAAL